MKAYNLIYLTCLPAYLGEKVKSITHIHYSVWKSNSCSRVLASYHNYTARQFKLHQSTFLNVFLR